MTAPYKIAIAAAATLLLVVIASLLLQPPPETTGPTAVPTPGAQPMAGARSAPPPPPTASFNSGPTALNLTRAAPPTVTALPFGNPSRSSHTTAPKPPADPARLEFLPPQNVPPTGEIFDVGRTAFDAQGKPRPSLFAPQPVPRPASPAAAAAPRPSTITSAPPITLIAPAPSAPTYTIKSGESLSSIALELYGSGNHWIEIAQANPLVDPDRLKVGQIIKLPGPAGTTPTLPPPSTPDLAPVPDLGPGTRYTIKENDTLSGIAKQFYNAASKWQLIYQANRQAIGSDPGRMKPGTVLIIPPPDSGAR